MSYLAPARERCANGPLRRRTGVPSRGALRLRLPRRAHFAGRRSGGSLGGETIHKGTARAPHDGIERRLRPADMVGAHVMHLVAQISVPRTLGVGFVGARNQPARTYALRHAGLAALEVVEDGITI